MGFLIRPWEEDCRVTIDVPAEWNLIESNFGDVTHHPLVRAFGGRIWFFWQPETDRQARWGWYDPAAKVFSPPYLGRIGTRHWEPYSYFYGSGYHWYRWGEKYLVLITGEGPSTV